MRTWWERFGQATPSHSVIEMVNVFLLKGSDQAFHRKESQVDLQAMNPQVSRQAALVARAVVAMSTLKGLLSSVQPQVSRQVALVARAVVAMSTLKGLLSSVQPQARRQAALVARAVVAVSTLKGLLSSVQPQVRRQAALLCESRVAVLTNVRGHGHSARDSEVVNETHNR